MDLSSCGATALHRGIFGLCGLGLLVRERRMARLDQLLKYIDKSSLGIEVAPYFNPALPKAAGHQVMILDVFDTDALREYARKDPWIEPQRISEIEEVDIVGDASRIGEMVHERNLSGQISFVISSHNFEHLPNPIKFLRGCSDALKPGGMLSMAVPDCRACFDHFRFPTRLAEWLSAFHNDQSQPKPEQLFDLQANRAVFMMAGEERPGCNIDHDDPAGFQLIGDIRTAYDHYLKLLETPGTYEDCHCSLTFPETFELMVRDLRYLGLLNLEIVEVSRTHGFEYYVHLRKPLQASASNEADYAAQRSELLRKISQSLGAAPYAKGFSKLFSARSISRSLFSTFGGGGFYDRLRLANRRRLAKHRKK
jgi:SAM-dependent methyltransferase